MNKQIGKLTKTVIDILDLDYKEELPIYIGNNNINHIKKQHLEDFNKYRNRNRKHNKKS